MAREAQIKELIKKEKKPNIAIYAIALGVILVVAIAYLTLSVSSPQAEGNLLTVQEADELASEIGQDTEQLSSDIKSIKDLVG